jgi:hypothetical protein
MTKQIGHRLRHKFLSIDNFRNVNDIFTKFLQEKYALEVNDGNIDIRKIIFETMRKVSNNDALADYDLLELNKVTLSIVKNVVKNKLSIDKNFNSSLIRNRDIDKKNVNLHTFNRPVSTSDPHAMSDVHSQFEKQSTIRVSEGKINGGGMGTDGVPFKEDVAGVDEVAFTDDEFKAKLASLEDARRKDQQPPDYININKSDHGGSSRTKSNTDNAPDSIGMADSVADSVADRALGSTSIFNDYKDGRVDTNIMEPFISSDFLPNKDATPKDLYESNNRFNDNLVNALREVNNTTRTFAKDYHEPAEKQRIILEERYLLINSQDRNWLRDKKRYEYAIYFTDQSKTNHQVPYYENNPTIPFTKGSGGEGIANLTGWVDPSTSTVYQKYDRDIGDGNLVGYEDVFDLVELNASVGNVFKNIHSIQINKVIIPLNIFLLNKHNFNVAAIEIDSVNRDYDFNINFPYVLLKIGEFGNVYQGTDEVTRMSFCQLVYDSSFKCPNGRGYIILTPTQNERKVFYPTALSSLTSLTFSLMKPNGELLNESTDGQTIFKIKNSSINNNRFLQVITNRYFSRNDFYKGDVIRIRNFNVYKITNSTIYDDNAIRRFNQFINRNEGHEIIENGDANPNGYFKFFYIKAMVSFDDLTGTDVVDETAIPSLECFEQDLFNHDAAISSGSFMNGHIINLSLQNSITISLKQQVHDSKVVASESIF